MASIHLLRRFQAAFLQQRFHGCILAAELPIGFQQIARARHAGRRVVAVGTTVVRTLESAALAQANQGKGDATLEPFSGDTQLFVRPGFRFRVVDAMVTNFHLSGSTLLMLCAAFVGREPLLAAYRHAVAAQYRFFSYGDAMFLTPSAAAKAAASP